jgi:hypothetical protein
MKTSTSGQGRKKGVPNKATKSARDAIALFVDGNADRLQVWLDQIALENPEKAFQLFQSVIEYHVPKMARYEHSGDADNPIRMQFSWMNTKK